MPWKSSRVEKQGLCYQLHRKLWIYVFAKRKPNRTFGILLHISTYICSKRYGKLIIKTLLEIRTKLTFIKIIESFRTVLFLSRALFIFGQTLFQSRFIQLPQVYTWMPWIALLLLWNISPWVNHLHLIYLLFFLISIQCFKNSEHLAIGLHPSSSTVFNF